MSICLLIRHSELTFGDKLHNEYDRTITSLEQRAWLDYEQSFDLKVKADVRNEFWRYGDNELVGHGEQTNDKCDTFKKLMGCLNFEAHNASRWFNSDLKKDSVFVKSVYHSCDKPTCPKCFKFGWAPREASRMEKRLREASNSYGLIEHIMASVPAALYSLRAWKLCVRRLPIFWLIVGLLAVP
jgi:hypothetical protein